MYTLSFDTSSKYFSLCLAKEENIIYKDLSETPDSHNEKLALAVQKALAENSLRASDIERVVVGEGPGSFTGLRIGFGFAKGFCIADRKEFIPVSSFEGAVRSLKVKTKFAVVLSRAGKEQYFYCWYEFIKEDHKVKARSNVKIATKEEIYKEQQKMYFATNQELTLITFLGNEDIFEEFDSDYQRRVAKDVASGLFEAFLISSLKGRPKDQGNYVNYLSALEPKYVREVSAKSLKDRGLA